MTNISEIFLRKSAWVNPTHDLATVLILLQGHALSCLPVIEGGRLIGMVSPKHLLGVEAHRQVQEVMDTTLPSLPLSLSLQEAADMMMKTRSECLPVVDAEGAFIGTIDQTTLLSALRYPLDPLTGLPWSDRLREWAIARLQAGQEITLLFLDVNDFGLFNKQYGHVVGDAILRQIAQTLQERTDSEREVVCRYGGDEFAIASLRTSLEIAILAEQITADVAQHVVMQISEDNEDPASGIEKGRVSITAGWHGGQRTQERDHVHYMATVNNLINLASKNCLANKVTSHSSSPMASAPNPPSPPLPDLIDPNPDPTPTNVLTALPIHLRTSLPLPLIDIKQEDKTTSIQIKWHISA